MRLVNKMADLLLQTRRSNSRLVIILANNAYLSAEPHYFAQPMLAIKNCRLCRVVKSSLSGSSSFESRRLPVTNSELVRL